MKPFPLAGDFSWIPPNAQGQFRRFLYLLTDSLLWYLVSHRFLPWKRDCDPGRSFAAFYPLQV